MTDIADRPHVEETPLVSPVSGARPLRPGQVLLVMLGAFVLAGLFNSARFVHAAETMPLGWQRTALLHVARPFDSVAKSLHTDRPRQRIDTALGRAPDNGGAFEPPAGVLPTVTPSPGASSSASPAPSVAFRDASPSAPLRLFVTGDSMIEFMAPKLLKRGEETHALTGSSEVKYGTGLVRDDVLNWPQYAHQQMVKHDPEAVIMMMGGNDGQGITLPGGQILHEGSPEWTAEYQRRATITMQVLTEGGTRHVYWVGMPPPKSARLFGLYTKIDASLKAAAAAVPNVTYVDIWSDFAPDGHYTDFVDGQLVRARDGIHLNRDGSARLMRTLFAILDEDWKLTS